jgi:hypothetical protein
MDRSEDVDHENKRQTKTNARHGADHEDYFLPRLTSYSLVYSYQRFGRKLLPPPPTSLGDGTTKLQIFTLKMDAADCVVWAGLVWLNIGIRGGLL